MTLQDQKKCLESGLMELSTLCTILKLPPLLLGNHWFHQWTFERLHLLCYTRKSESMNYRVSQQVLDEKF